MKSRGEKHYINMPSFAVRLYDDLTSVKGVNRGFEEISSFVEKNLRQGRLLDVGTGPGRLLFEINKRIPNLELYGIDISASMLDRARQNLKTIKDLNLQVGNIVQTDFPDGFFDCIVSSGSFYNWDKPIEGLNETYRILKPGRTAYIFETHRDFNSEFSKSALRMNLKEYNFLRRIISKYFLKRQLKMTYAVKEFDDILKLTDFRKSYNIARITLGNLPIYVRLELSKL